MPEKILTYVFLPPGGILLLMLVAWFFTREKTRLPGLLLLGSTLLLYLLSIPPVSRALLYPLEEPYFVQSEAPAEAIVILGGGAYGRCGDFLCLSESSLKRALRGYFLWKKTELPVIVSGGRLRGSSPTEAEKMENFLRRLGVKEIIREEKAINTRGEAVEVGKILRARGWKRVYLVTSAFHMKRSIFAFRSRGIEAIPVATDFRSGMQGFPLLPSTRALDNSFIALHEHSGLVYYRLRAFLLPGGGP